jgi:hypothetical protein
MSRTVSEKMGIKEGTRAIFVNAPEAAQEAIDPPSFDVASGLAREVDHIPPFRNNTRGARRRVPEAHLKPAGMLWVSWPSEGPVRRVLFLHPPR